MADQFRTTARRFFRNGVGSQIEIEKAMTDSNLKPETTVEHAHRRPTKKDFEGKTVKRFIQSGDNVWKLWFTDGTKLAIQSDLFSGLACMEVCDVCGRR